MTKKPFLAAMAACSLAALTACGSDAGDEDTAGGEVSSDTLAALIEQADDRTTVAEIMGNSGLQGVFDGNAPYTVFAPSDAAFAETDLPPEGEGGSAARVALLREHIVPGFLSREDIVAAIESGGGSVEMQTMGSNTLTFTGDADGLTVASSDGSQANISGDVLSGVNGSIIPVDGLLKSMEAPE